MSTKIPDRIWSEPVIVCNDLPHNDCRHSDIIVKTLVIEIMKNPNIISSHDSFHAIGQLAWLNTKVLHANCPLDSCLQRELRPNVGFLVIEMFDDVLMLSWTGEMSQLGVNSAIMIKIVVKSVSSSQTRLEEENEEYVEREFSAAKNSCRVN